LQKVNRESQNAPNNLQSTNQEQKMRPQISGSKNVNFKLFSGFGLLKEETNLSM